MAKKGMQVARKGALGLREGNEKPSVRAITPREIHPPDPCCYPVPEDEFVVKGRGGKGGWDETRAFAKLLGSGSTGDHFEILFAAHPCLPSLPLPQELPLTNERFMVPEGLLHPTAFGA